MLSPNAAQVERVKSFVSQKFFQKVFDIRRLLLVLAVEVKGQIAD